MKQAEAENRIEAPAQKIDLPPAGDVDNLKSATKSIEHCVEWLEKLPAGDWRSWALRMVEATIKAHEAKAAPAESGAAVK